MQSPLCICTMLGVYNGRRTISSVPDSNHCKCCGLQHSQHSQEPLWQGAFVSILTCKQQLGDYLTACCTLSYHSRAAVWSEGGVSVYRTVSATCVITAPVTCLCCVRDSRQHQCTGDRKSTSTGRCSWWGPSTRCVYMQTALALQYDDVPAGYATVPTPQFGSRPNALNYACQHAV